MRLEDHFGNGSILQRNERVKLAASFWNNIGAGMVIGGMAGRGACVKSSGIGGNKKSQSDNYREQSHRCYPNDQKRQCGRVVVEPMFVHAHEDHSPCKNERVMNAALKR